MSRYIDIEPYEKDGWYLQKRYHNEHCEVVKTTPLISVPTAEAEPVKHGQWLIGVGENGEPIGTYCSECGWSWERNIAAIQLNKVLSRIETPRCPYCGAIMDGEDNG